MSFDHQTTQIGIYIKKSSYMCNVQPNMKLLYPCSYLKLFDSKIVSQIDKIINYQCFACIVATFLLNLITWIPHLYTHFRLDSTKESNFFSNPSSYFEPPARTWQHKNNQLCTRLYANDVTAQ